MVTTSSQAREQEFEQLFKSNYSRLFYYALDFVGDEEIAKDVVSECFGDVWKQYEAFELRFRDAKASRAYLYRMVKNKCLNVLKHQAVVDEYSREILDMNELWEEDYLLHEERIALLQKVADGFTPQTKLVYELCCLQGMKYAEAAEQLGVSTHAVHKHVSKAMQQLREAFLMLKKDENGWPISS